MRKLTRFAVATTAVVCLGLSSLATSAQASIVNGGFEAGGGSFDGWARKTLVSTMIETAVFGVDPTGGGHHALLRSGLDTGTPSTALTPEVESDLGLLAGTMGGLGVGSPMQGSFIYQDITVSAGDELFFDWNFLTNETTPSTFNDFAFFSVSGPETVAMLLADTFSIFDDSDSAAFDSETGYSTGSFMFSTAGTYRIGFGVMDEGDFSRESGLLLDNIRLSSVPEPASVAMWSLVGLAGLAVVRRRRSK